MVYGYWLSLINLQYYIHDILLKHGARADITDYTVRTICFRGYITHNWLALTYASNFRRHFFAVLMAFFFFSPANRATRKP